MIDPHVRRAEERDAVVLGELEAEARAALVGVRGGGRWLEEHEEVGAGWRDAIDRRAVFVGSIDDVLVAYLLLDVDESVAHVDQVYVAPDARELGFGDALLDAATDEARRSRATLLEGHALPGDRDTKNLYERAGVTARLITVSKRLD